MAENRSKSDQYLLRLPPGLRARLQDDADSHSRSLNAEIVARLEDYPNMVKVLHREGRARAELADDKERLLWELERLEDVKQRFFDEAGKLKPVLTLPQNLFDRIKIEALRNHRAIDDEALAALEKAFPPQSIDINLLSAFLSSLIGVSAPDGDKDYLDYINDAFSKIDEPWTVSAGWDGLISFIPVATPREPKEDKEDKAAAKPDTSSDEGEQE